MSWILSSFHHLGKKTRPRQVPPIPRPTTTATTAAANINQINHYPPPTRMLWFLRWHHRHRYQYYHPRPPRYPRCMILVPDHDYISVILCQLMLWTCHYHHHRLRTKSSPWTCHYHHHRRLRMLSLWMLSLWVWHSKLSNGINTTHTHTLAILRPSRDTHMPSLPILTPSHNTQTSSQCPHTLAI